MRTTVPTLPERHKNVAGCHVVNASVLDRSQAELVAARGRALSDPTRVQILDLLVQQPGPLCECDLIPRFAQRQPTISHHLRILREAGLVDTEKQGLYSHYWPTALGRTSLEVCLTLLAVE
jgi:ArsR family transcriptional regulator